MKWVDSLMDLVQMICDDVVKSNQNEKILGDDRWL